MVEWAFHKKARSSLLQKQRQIQLQLNIKKEWFYGKGRKYRKNGLGAC